MLSKKILSTVLASALAAAFSAHADNSFSWRFSGFGTAGYAATDSNDVMLVNPRQLKGAQKGGSGLMDSRIGGQLDFTFSPKFSATAQAIAMQDPSGRFRPTVEWAFLRYKLTSETTVRVGRLGWPAYLVSDYRYVGYANPWVRAPLEVYNLAALDSYEGADITWSHDAGTGYLTLQALAGHASTPLPYSTQATARLKVNQLAGAYITYEIGNLRLRGGASTGNVTYRTDGLTQLVGGLRMAGFGQYANHVNTDGARTTFMSLGGNYDNGRLLLTGEYARLHSASDLLGTATGWYATAGYHFGQWMPYVTWAGYKKKDQSTNYAFPPYPPLLPLAEGVDSLVAGNSQHSASLGIRWDVHQNVAIKAQADHVLPSPAGGTFKNVAPGYDGHAVNVYSVVVDFLF